MDSPVLVILAILAIGVLFVALPVVLAAFGEHRGTRPVLCPEAGRLASIQLDAGRAARCAILGRSLLSVESCSLWPERRGCAERCLSALAAEPLEPAEDGDTTGFRA